MRRMTIALAVGWLAIPVALASTTTGAATIGHAVFHPGAILTRGALLQSTNWSGVADTGGRYTAVKGSWKVPTVMSAPGNRFASDWVGIGGFNTGDLIQAGTSEQFVNGSASYNAWTEIIPAPEVVIPGFAIHAGDADPKLLAYQYLQMLPQIAQGDSNKIWLIPTEFSHALDRFQEQFTADASGKAPIPPVTKNLAAER